MYTYIMVQCYTCVVPHVCMGMCMCMYVRGVGGPQQRVLRILCPGYIFSHSLCSGIQDIFSVIGCVVVYSVATPTFP